MSNVRNFDALVTVDQPESFELVGRTWQLPPELPHQAVLYIEAVMADEGEQYELGYTELHKLAVMVFGEPTVQEWVDAGVGVRRLSAVVEWAVETLGGQLTSSDDTEQPSEGDAPNP